MKGGYFHCSRWGAQSGLVRAPRRGEGGKKKGKRRGRGVEKGSCTKRSEVRYMQRYAMRSWGGLVCSWFVSFDTSHPGYSSSLKFASVPWLLTDFFSS